MSFFQYFGYLGISLVFTLLTPILKAQGEIDLARGLVAYYSYHNQQLSSLKDAKVNPTLLSGASFTFNRFGDGESALNFDGNQQNGQIAFSPGLSIDKKDGYALSFWIRPMDDNSGCLVLKEGDYGVKWNGIRSPLSVFDGMANGFPTGKFSDWDSDRWYHIVLNKKPDELSLFINGQLDQKWAVKPKESVASKSLFIGKHPYFLDVAPPVACCLASMAPSKKPLLVVSRGQLLSC
ncbi:MAG: LamG-like jellyroll fold domain-containing protein [Bacteroidota bacterium]